MNKENTWVQEVTNLSSIARTEPHCALAAFTHGLRNRYVYYMRTIPNINAYLQPLEDAIKNNLLPHLFQGHNCNDAERKLFSLSPKFVGLGVINPIEISDAEYRNSRAITKDIVNAINVQKDIYEEDTSKINLIKNQLKSKKDNKSKAIFEDIKSSNTNPQHIKLMASSIEQGVYNWFTALPLQQYGYYFDKKTFWDTIRNRHNLPMSPMPEKCVCSSDFDIEHALNCKKGGFITNRHNNIRDLTAKLLNEVTNDVEVEPLLEPKTGEQLRYKSSILTDNARADIAARSVWINDQRAYSDVRVFNPLPHTYRDISLKKIYERNEKEKKIAYVRHVKLDKFALDPWTQIRERASKKNVVVHVT